MHYLYWIWEKYHKWYSIPKMIFDAKNYKYTIFIILLQQCIYEQLGKKKTRLVAKILVTNFDNHLCMGYQNC